MLLDVYELQFNAAYEIAKKLYAQDGKLSSDKLEKYNEIEKLTTKDEGQ